MPPTLVQKNPVGQNWTIEPELQLAFSFALHSLTFPPFLTVSKLLSKTSLSHSSNRLSSGSRSPHHLIHHHLIDAQPPTPLFDTPGWFEGLSDFWQKNSPVSRKNMHHWIQEARARSLDTASSLSSLSSSSYLEPIFWISLDCWATPVQVSSWDL